jgi:hypothetical protein
MHKYHNSYELSNKKKKQLSLAITSQIAEPEGSTPLTTKPTAEYDCEPDASSLQSS